MLILRRILDHRCAIWNKIANSAQRTRLQLRLSFYTMQRLAKGAINIFEICSGEVRTTNFLYSELPLRVQGEDVILCVELS